MDESKSRSLANFSIMRMEVIMIYNKESFLDEKSEYHLCSFLPPSLFLHFTDTRKPTLNQ